MALSAKACPATSDTGYLRRDVFFVLILGASLLGCPGPTHEKDDAMMPGGAEITFERYEVVIGPAKRQTVLTGFLLGGALAELAVVNINEDDERRVRVYTFNSGTWVPRFDTKLRPAVLFVDVAKIGGHEHLVTYEPGRLNGFDPKSASEQQLVQVTSNFKPPRKSEIPHVDISRDVNADKRDDLVVPDVDGFWVFIQMPDGAFADPVKIGPPTDMSWILGADGYRYDPWGQSRVHEMDYNQDGRSDLVFWDEDRFKVHLQDERGLFAPVAETFKTDVAFDADNLSLLTNGDMTGKVLYSLTDLNGDGIGDLVIYSLQGKRISKKHSTYEVHYGKPTPAGATTFASEIGATFQSDDRIQLRMDRQDFDGDGQVDVMLTTIELRFLSASLWKNIKGLMGDDIWLDLEFYRHEGGQFRDKPNAIHRIALDGAPSHREPGSVSLDVVLRGATHERRKTQKRWARAFNTLLLAGDVTGDGRSDLFIGKNTPNGMDVIVGVPGPDLFTRWPQDVPVVVPNDQEYAWLVDVNKDGKQDILLHDPFTLRDVHGAPRQAPGTESHRVTILVAR